MLREIWTYLTTKTTQKSARIFGHLYESIALIEREKRCRLQWESHCNNCKNAILNQAQIIKNKNAVLILGSGHLHEIPIEELAVLFKKIHLVDIVHLRKTKKKYRHLHNVHFIEADITELEDQLIKNKRPTNKVPTLLQFEKYDLVVSANVLSQLTLHLKNYLAKNAQPNLSDAELNQFLFQVSADHYQYLNNFKTHTVLITDVETQIMNANEEVLEVETPYINFSLPALVEEWWWNVAPLNEYQKDHIVKMKVAVFVLNFDSDRTLINS